MRVPRRRFASIDKGGGDWRNESHPRRETRQRHALPVELDRLLHQRREHSGARIGGFERVRASTLRLRVEQDRLQAEVDHYSADR